MTTTTQDFEALLSRATQRGLTDSEHEVRKGQTELCRAIDDVCFAAHMTQGGKLDTLDIIQALAILLGASIAVHAKGCAIPADVLRIALLKEVIDKMVLAATVEG